MLGFCAFLWTCTQLIAQSAQLTDALNKLKRFNGESEDCEPEYLLEPGGVIMGLEHDGFVKAVIDEYFPMAAGCKGRGSFKVIDVGVNTGAITLKAAQHGARVLGFEAIPSNHQQVEHRLWLNDFDRDKQVQVFNMGAGAVDDQRLHFAENHYERPDPSDPSHDVHTTVHKGKPAKGVIWQKTGHFVTEEQAEGRGDVVVVSVNTVDTMANKVFGEGAQILLFKIDVDGMEPQVLQGSEGLLKGGKVQVMHIEYDAQSWPVTTLPKIMKYGYRVFIEDCSHNIRDEDRDRMYDMGHRCVSQEKAVPGLVNSCKMKSFEAMEKYEITPQKYDALYQFLNDKKSTVNLVLCRSTQ
jgi:FkbM family methyltransferase